MSLRKNFPADFLTLHIWLRWRREVPSTSFKLRRSKELLGHEHMSRGTKVTGDASLYQKRWPDGINSQRLNHHKKWCCISEEDRHNPSGLNGCEWGTPWDLGMTTVVRRDEVSQQTAYWLLATPGYQDHLPLHLPLLAFRPWGCYNWIS